MSLSWIRKCPRPLQEHVVISLCNLLIHLSSFLLFLLVGLSLPIIKSIYIIDVAAYHSVDPISDAATELRFGVWGACAYSPLNTSQCIGPQLGYTVPSYILTDVGIATKTADLALGGLLILLVLHLVCAGLSTVVFGLSLFLHDHDVALAALIIAAVCAALGTVVFAADLAIVLVVKSKINTLFSGATFTVNFGNAVWMILAAVVATWIAVGLLSARVCYCCGVRRPAKTTTDSEKSSEAHSE